MQQEISFSPVKNGSVSQSLILINHMTFSDNKLQKYPSHQNSQRFLFTVFIIASCHNVQLAATALSTKTKQNNYKMLHCRCQCCHDSPVCPVVTTSFQFTSLAVWPHSRVNANRNSQYIPNPLTVNWRPDVLYV